MWWRGAQELGFGLVQAYESRLLAGGAQQLDLDARPRHVTSVARVPGELAGVLTDVVRGLDGVEGHYVYPCGDLHLTVLNLDADRQPVPDRVRAARDALARTPGFGVVLAGLGVSRSSVYARAYDTTGELWRLRGRIARATGCRPPLPLRLLGFVNLVRFARSNVGDLARDLARVRRLPLGVLEVTAVQIVCTDKVLSAAQTVVLETIALA